MSRYAAPQYGAKDGMTPRSFARKYDGAPAPARPRILIVYYSAYGHIKALADELRKGIEEAGGDAVLMQCAETLPASVVDKMGAQRQRDLGDPVLDDPRDLVDADGILFGAPTRFGMCCAQMKARARNFCCYATGFMAITTEALRLHS